MFFMRQTAKAINDILDNEWHRKNEERWLDNKFSMYEDAIDDGNEQRAREICEELGFDYPLPIITKKQGDKIIAGLMELDVKTKKEQLRKDIKDILKEILTNQK